MLVVLALLFSPGCERRQALKLHYTGHPAKVFFPAKIAVAPATVPIDLDVGQVVDRAGYRQTKLYLPDPGTQVADLLARSLADAGLHPVPIASAPLNGDLPMGVDFVITSTVEQLRCIKRYLPEADGAGPGFMMSASAQIHFTLANRGRELYSVTEFGEAKGPSHGERADSGQAAFSEPGDALSAAVMRTITRLLSEPRFRQALPHYQS